MVSFFIYLFYGFVAFVVLGCLAAMCLPLVEEANRLAEEEQREKRTAEIVALATEVNGLVKDLTPAVELQMLDYLVNMANKLQGGSTLLSRWEKVKSHVEEYLNSGNRDLIDLAWHNNEVRTVRCDLDGWRYHNGIESSHNLRITSVMCALQGNVYGAAICLLKSLIKGAPVVKNTVTNCLKEDKEEVQEILSKLREFARGIGYRLPYEEAIRIPLETKVSLEEVRSIAKRTTARQNSVDCTLTINEKVFKVENKTFDIPEDIGYDTGY